MVGIFMILFVAMALILLIALSVGLIVMGEVIDTHPNAKSRFRPGLSSPGPATRITVLLCLLVYLVGFVFVVAGSFAVVIVGLCLIVYSVLIVLTGVIISLAVLRVLNSKGSKT